MSGAANATILGYDLDPLGTRDGVNVGYSLWDAFSGFSFSFTSPDASSGTAIFSGKLKSSATDGIVVGGGDALYQGNTTGGTVPSAFSIEGGTGTGASAIVMQLKFTPPTINGGDPLSYYSVSLTNVGAPSSISLVGQSEGYDIVSYSWTGLNFGSGARVAFSITSPADHVALDGISVDVAPVPEPATWMSLAAGLAFLTLVNRSRLVRR